MSSIRIDRYVLDTLMSDLVLHDHRPSAFLVYLQLWAHRGRRGRVQVSHQEMATRTGLSKSSVQSAVRVLSRRRLVRGVRSSATAIPEYIVLRPWRR